MKLSIIIPAYNAEPYIDELLKRLNDQMIPVVEVIVVDDGSRFPYLAPYPWVKVIRQQNGGVSSARNAGLDVATGEYVAFIDADDLISKDYVEKVFLAMREDPDFIYLSWETFGEGWKAKVKITDETQKFPPWNQCVWNRIYKRSMIGDVRFNEKKIIAEDAEFIRKVKEKGRKKAFIPETVYFYRTTQRNSLTERFNRGEVDMDRIVYYYPQLPKELGPLIREIERESESAEVIVMTYDNSEELEEACMVLEPAPINATERRGVYTNEVNIIERPIRAQVVIYQGRMHEIGGVETWIFNFVKIFKDKYDILVLHGQQSSETQLDRLREMVPVMRNGNKKIVCDTFLNMRITDEVPKNIVAKQVIQLCHLCQMKENYQIQKKHDLVIFPSEVAKKSFEVQTEGKVIQNMTLNERAEKALFLVSASRFTYEKGEQRMYVLADRLKKAGIPFVWLVFTDAEIRQGNGIIKMSPTMDVKSYVAAADYLVQLSDKESFCYSIVEALEQETAVLTTPIEVLKEIEFQDGVHGYVLPFDMIITDEKLETIWKEVPEIVSYGRKKENARIKKQWTEILGDTKKRWKEFKGQVKIRVIYSYYDTEKKRMVSEGEEFVEEAKRAEWLIRNGVAKLANNAKIDVL